MHSVGRRWFKHFTTATVGYTLAVISTVVILNGAFPLPIQYLAALLPVIPIGYGIHGYTRFLRNIDELQQRIQLSGLGFAVGGTGLLTVSWGFLELVGLTPLPTIWVFPMLIFFWGIGVAIASRRYQ
jgi:hypothetical protein